MGRACGGGARGLLRRRGGVRRATGGVTVHVARVGSDMAWAWGRCPTALGTDAACICSPRRHPLGYAQRLSGRWSDIGIQSFRRGATNVHNIRLARLHAVAPGRCPIRMAVRHVAHAEREWSGGVCVCARASPVLRNFVTIGGQDEKLSAEMEGSLGFWLWAPKR